MSLAKAEFIQGRRVQHPRRRALTRAKPQVLPFALALVWSLGSSTFNYHGLLEGTALASSFDRTGDALGAAPSEPEKPTRWKDALDGDNA